MKYIVVLSLVAACSSRPEMLSEKAKDIEVHQVKPAQCRVVGKVEGVNDQGSKELALNDALNQAADKGANGLFVDQEVPNGKKMMVYATAYDCD